MGANTRTAPSTALDATSTTDRVSVWSSLPRLPGAKATDISDSNKDRPSRMPLIRSRVRADCNSGNRFHVRRCARSVSGFALWLKPDRCADVTAANRDFTAV